MGQAGGTVGAVGADLDDGLGELLAQQGQRGPRPGEQFRTRVVGLVRKGEPALVRGPSQQGQGFGLGRREVGEAVDENGPHALTGPEPAGAEQSAGPGRTAVGVVEVAALEVLAVAGVQASTFAVAGPTAGGAGEAQGRHASATQVGHQGRRRLGEAAGFAHSAEVRQLARRCQVLHHLLEQQPSLHVRQRAGGRVAGAHHLEEELGKGQ